MVWSARNPCRRFRYGDWIRGRDHLFALKIAISNWASSTAGRPGLAGFRPGSKRHRSWLAGIPNGGASSQHLKSPGSDDVCIVHLPGSRKPRDPGHPGYKSQTVPSQRACEQERKAPPWPNDGQNGAPRFRRRNPTSLCRFLCVSVSLVNRVTCGPFWEGGRNISTEILDTRLRPKLDWL